MKRLWRRVRCLIGAHTHEPIVRYGWLNKYGRFDGFALFWGERCIHCGKTEYHNWYRVEESEDLIFAGEE